ncbi:sulfotransferase domain-containing protein [Ponticaulis sp.]|uniref:sulfotransferase domain-containing protein n=1 Tax=Ponticaulis sp. TaxID=2020902 RepID=UPI000B7101A5|nr:sulfotransferase domain-containing protein [Ponticaulis sp.]MAI91054.1 sulfotransferase family protein [Ponticaulis sp.]OUX98386.1 MAG: sulfotransferase family protein [Hyphomonadaceae bacterium TMED5]|tara:strand:+ start:85328 stop:86140 length:813 start_codon:yes stop_codon:yes gene_type:complete
MSDPYSSRVWKDNWLNGSVFRHGRLQGCLVTSKNSGTHWIKYMLSVALADTYCVEPPEYFSEASTQNYIGNPKNVSPFKELPALAFAHTIPHALMDQGWSHSLFNLPPYVLQVRHPMQILASHFTKWSYQLQTDWLTYLRGDPAGDMYRCDLFWLARFWNRWGDLMQKFPEKILRVHYDEVQADARGRLKAISDHWNINLTPESIEKALLAGTKEAMALKVDPNAEKNVLQQRKHDLEDLFTGEALEIYQSIVGDYFRHDLGYDLLAVPA